MKEIGSRAIVEATLILFCLKGCFLEVYPMVAIMRIFLKKPMVKVAIYRLTFE